MKKNYILYLCILFISCGNRSNSNEEKVSKKLDTSNFNKERFSKNLDTFYKDNSLDIDFIIRTFYSKDKNILNDNLKLTQHLGEEKYYTLSIYHNRNIGSVIIEDSISMLKLFDDMNTVISNTEKKLRYKFGSSIISNGEIYSFGNKEEISISISTDGKKTVYMNVNKAEIDSMKSCFLRYNLGQ